GGILLPPFRVRVRCSLCLVLAVWILARPALVQGQVDPPATEPPPADAGSAPAMPKRVDVEPVARDAQIASRLQRILTATGWFIDPDVRVEEGVVFLDGQTRSDVHRQWAGNLASSTQDVV